MRPASGEKRGAEPNETAYLRVRACVRAACVSSGNRGKCLLTLTLVADHAAAHRQLAAARPCTAAAARSQPTPARCGRHVQQPRPARTQGRLGERRQWVASAAHSWRSKILELRREWYAAALPCSATCAHSCAPSVCVRARSLLCVSACAPLCLRVVPPSCQCSPVGEDGRTLSRGSALGRERVLEKFRVLEEIQGTRGNSGF
jgi:hypothetical protein